MPYTFITFNVPGASSTSATGIAENGRIVGFDTANGITHGFLDRVDTFTAIDDPTGRATFASGINDPGAIVGYYIDSGGLAHGFRDDDGTFATHDDPLAVHGTFAQGINEPGRIVGFYADTNGLDHGFLLNRGTYTTIDDPLGTNGTFAEDLNNPGQIVGYYKDNNQVAHGFIDDKGAFTTLNDPQGSRGTVALGINEEKQVVGYYIDSNGLRHGFLYSGGTYTTIDDPLGAGGTVAESINDEGQIVGYYADASGVQHGFRAETLTPAGGLAVFDTGWAVLGTGMTTGDGMSDLIWRNSDNNTVEVQLLGGTMTLAGGGVINNSPFDANWRAAAVGDFNGDGMTDIAYQRVSDGLTEVQFLNGTTAMGGGIITNNPFDKTWKIVATGDFNADGKTDLVWQHQSDGMVDVQLLDGNTAIGGGVIANNPFGQGWKVAGAADFNGDGKTDLVWQHQGDGLAEIQFLDSNSAIGGGVIANNPFGAGWNIVGVGDVNGDGMADLVWEHQGDHTVEVQFLDGNDAIGGGVIPGSPFGSDWTVVGTGDFNGDGKTDLVYRRVNDGTTEVQYLNGLNPIGGGVTTLGGFSPGHSIMAP
jgi:probable HAF family extracellular repeat protein